MTTQRVPPRIGRVQLGAIPRVVLAVDGDPPALVRQPRKAGVDLLEARVDQFDRLNPEAVARQIARLKRVGLPLIGTVRARAEGGAANLSDRQRRLLYERIIPLVEAVDVDVRSSSVVKAVIAAARTHHTTVILSHHDFKKTPSATALGRIVRRADHLGADLIKVAAMARGPEDVARLLQLTLTHHAKPLVTIAMGPHGSLSRLLFPLAGSLLTYTHRRPSHGQLPLHELVSLLRRCYPTFAATHPA